VKVLRKVKDTIQNLRPSQEEDKDFEKMQKYVLGIIDKHTDKMETGNHKKESRETTEANQKKKPVASTKLGKKKKGFAEKEQA